MLRFLLTLVLLLFAFPAGATWYTGPGATGNIVTALNPTGRKVAFYDFTGTDQSAVLNVAACSSVTILLNSDTTAETTGGEGYIYTCTSSTASVNTCEEVYTDAGAVTLNGDASTGRDAIYGLTAAWIYFDVTANAGADAGRVVAICSP